LQRYSRNAVATNSGQLFEKILFIVDVLLNSTGNVINCFDYAVGMQ